MAAFIQENGHMDAIIARSASHNYHTYGSIDAATLENGHTNVTLETAINPLHSCPTSNRIWRPMAAKFRLALRMEWAQQSPQLLLYPAHKSIHPPSHSSAPLAITLPGIVNVPSVPRVFLVRKSWWRMFLISADDAIVTWMRRISDISVSCVIRGLRLRVWLPSIDIRMLKTRRFWWGMLTVRSWLRRSIIRRVWANEEMHRRLELNDIVKIWKQFLFLHGHSRT